MREILFRGKSRDNGEWIEGYYVHYPDEVYDGKDDYDFIVMTRDVISLGKPSPFVRAIPETVGQFTGFVDKNGKKIFEGDIITIGSSKAGVGVRFGNRGWECYTDEFGPYWGHYLAKEMTYEIIGNIHDNPELVEVK